MDAGDVRSYVARTNWLRESSPPSTRAETRTWLVDPLLETLGWKSGEETRVPDRSVAGTTFEYVLTVADTPVAFVAVEPCTDGLDREREASIRRAMAATGVDRAIYTDGRDLVVLTGPTGDDRHTLERGDLEANVDRLASVSRATLSDHLASGSRALAARRLAADRQSLERELCEALLARTGEAYREAFDQACERFVDRTIEALAGEDVRAAEGQFARDDEDADAQGGEPVVEGDLRGDVGGVDLDEPEVKSAASVDAGVSTDSSDDGTADTSVDGDGASDTSVDGGGASDTSVDGGGASEPSVDGDGASEPSTGSPSAETDAAGTTNERGERATEGDRGGEYVVRFFADRGSIGAVGHSNPAEAMAAAAEFCFARGLSGVRLPWSPEGDDTILNDEPVLEDGAPMETYVRLENGTCLNTGGTIETQAARIEALASRAGLRAMLTGDW